MSKAVWSVALSIVTGVATAIVIAHPVNAQPTGAQTEALPACPGVFAHGPYPERDNPTEKDQIRQPNHPTALRQQAALGSEGVEADVQLTHDGTKAVMWHNTTTNGLTGERAKVNELWWAAGDDALKGRTITRGPYEGETVYTLREYLDSAYANNIVPLIEVKSEAKQSLLHADLDVSYRAWDELLRPIYERHDRQEIMLYADKEDQELNYWVIGMAEAWGMEDVVANKDGNRPVWPDSVSWDEPPPDWRGNTPSWEKALKEEPRRIATDWPAEMHEWLKGKCA